MLRTLLLPPLGIPRKAVRAMLTQILSTQLLVTATTSYPWSEITTLTHINQLYRKRSVRHQYSNVYTNIYIYIYIYINQAIGQTWLSWSLMWGTDRLANDVYRKYDAIASKDTGAWNTWIRATEELLLASVVPVPRKAVERKRCLSGQSCPADTIQMGVLELKIFDIFKPIFKWQLLHCGGFDATPFGKFQIIGFLFWRIWPKSHFLRNSLIWPTNFDFPTMIIRYQFNNKWLNFSNLDENHVYANGLFVSGCAPLSAVSTAEGNVNFCSELNTASIFKSHRKCWWNV